jgi:hypothetical protein
MESAERWMTVAEVREQIEKTLGGDTRHEAPSLADTSVRDFGRMREIFAQEDMA